MQESQHRPLESVPPQRSGYRLAWLVGSQGHGQDPKRRVAEDGLRWEADGPVQVEQDCERLGPQFGARSPPMRRTGKQTLCAFMLLNHFLAAPAFRQTFLLLVLKANVVCCESRHQRQILGHCLIRC